MGIASRVELGSRLVCSSHLRCAVVSPHGDGFFLLSYFYDVSTIEWDTFADAKGSCEGATLECVLFLRGCCRLKSSIDLEFLAADVVASVKASCGGAT